MKTTKRNTINLVTFLLTMWTAQAALAFYNPEIGRWINRDPIGEAGSENLFLSFQNDPIAYIDPFGLNCKKTLTYEFLSRDTVGPFEPGNAIYVRSVTDITADLANQISKYDPDGDCCKGSCIKEIIISAHGSGAGTLTLGSLYYDVRSARYANSPVETGSIRILKQDYNAAHAGLQSIAQAMQGKMCTGGTIRFLVCGAGGCQEGADLQGNLEGIFTGTGVITYDGSAGFYPGGWPGTTWPGKKK
jgi:hypothetical protein